MNTSCSASEATVLRYASRHQLPHLQQTDRSPTECVAPTSYVRRVPILTDVNASRMRETIVIVDRLICNRIRVRIILPIHNVKEFDAVAPPDFANTLQTLLVE